MSWFKDNTLSYGDRSMKNLESRLGKHSKLILGFILILAVILRWWYLPRQNINFGYDQARDAFAIQEIINGHLKILGPPTSGAPGLFHGVLYYYVITPAYFFGQGNPLVVAYWMSFINALTILPVFYLAYLLTKKKLPSLMASIIFAFSLDAIQFSNFLSNVSLGILFIPIIFIGLFLWSKKSSKYAPLITGLAFGLAVQSEVAFCFYLAPIVFWLAVSRDKIKIREILTFVGSFLLAVSTMLIAEIKFSFPGIKGLVYLFTSQDDIAQGKQLGDFLITFMNQVGVRFADTIYPFNIAFGGLVGVSMVIISFILKKTEDEDGKNNFLTWQAFLASCIFAHIVALPFGGSITPYIMIGAIPAISVFIAIFLWKLCRGKDVLLFAVMALLLSVNLAKFITINNSSHPDYFTYDYLLSTEEKVLDYTYQKSEGKPFSISSLTSPLYVNTLWSYLYNWYGKEKYGFLPYWVGKDQIGQPGNNLPSAPIGTVNHFFIMEPPSQVPSLYVTYGLGEQNSISDLIEERAFGNFIVQYRLMKSGEKRK